MDGRDGRSISEGNVGIDSETSVDDKLVEVESSESVLCVLTADLNIKK